MAGLGIDTYKTTQAERDTARAYRLANKDSVRLASARWREANKDHLNSDEYRARQREYHRKWRAINREKLRERQREYERNNPEIIKRNRDRHKETEKFAATRFRLHIARKFSLTVEQYNEILASQGGVCKICRKQCDRRRNGLTKALAPLCVDHDHKTGAVRGLLCSKCNSALGLVNDDVETLRRAIDYLGGVSG
jgi:hypothetical protein